LQPHHWQSGKISFARSSGILNVAKSAATKLFKNLIYFFLHFFTFIIGFDGKFFIRQKWKYFFMKKIGTQLSSAYSNDSQSEINHFTYIVYWFQINLVQLTYHWGFTVHSIILVIHSYIKVFFYI
jgi:hypothetical protein